MPDFLAMKFATRPKTVANITAKKFAILALVLAVKLSKKLLVIAANKPMLENAEMRTLAVKRFVERPWTVETINARPSVIQDPVLNVHILLKR